jgi:chromosomal replication initiation ATPase DnaA
MMSELSLHVSRAEAHERHRQFHQRIKDAADRHAAKIAAQRDAAQEAILAKAVEAPKPVSIEKWRNKQMTKYGVKIEHDIDVRTVNSRTIQLAVAREYGVSLIDMLSGRRDNRVVIPRHVAFYLIKKLTLLSLPAIGRRFGGRDHTTVLHGVKKIERMMEANLVFAAKVEAIKSKLEADR